MLAASTSQNSLLEVVVTVVLEALLPAAAPAPAPVPPPVVATCAETPMLEVVLRLRFT